MAKLGVGEPAPQFDLRGTGIRTYRLSDYRGRWVVLAFYPGDFTPVCTKQFCSYRDEAAQVVALDAVLLGISPQSIESHERFLAEHALTVPLLADTEKRAASAYGVLGPGGFVRRAVFIVDAEGVVRHRHVAKVGIRFMSAEEIGRHLRELRAPA